MLALRIQATLLFTLLLFLAPGLASAETATRVFLNGVPTPVYFNDGDSFRVLAGPLKGTRARLAGFNTLESYGPVHQWGAWTRHELARFATLGTLNARQGVWRCTSDMDRDGYGRILWNCPDLTLSQVRKGLAHVMTVTAEGAEEQFVQAQKEAIEARRGLWAHGVPDFVMTSLHSAAEGYGRRPYNRLVASSDGHSEKMLHDRNYRECQTICQPSPDVDAERVAAFITELQANPDLSAALEGLDTATLTTLVTTYASEGLLNEDLPNEANRQALETVVSRAVSMGQLTTSQASIPCMVYVTFQRRYGDSRAACLR